MSGLVLTKTSMCLADHIRRVRGLWGAYDASYSHVLQAERAASLGLGALDVRAWLWESELLQPLQEMAQQ